MHCPASSARVRTTTRTTSGGRAHCWLYQCHCPWALVQGRPASRGLGRGTMQQGKGTQVKGTQVKALPLQGNSAPQCHREVMWRGRSTLTDSGHLQWSSFYALSVPVTVQGAEDVGRRGRLERQCRAISQPWGVQAECTLCTQQIVLVKAQTFSRVHSTLETATANPHRPARTLHGRPHSPRAIFMGILQLEQHGFYTRFHRALRFPTRYTCSNKEMHRDCTRVF
jgi:hypothetical protein